MLGSNLSVENGLVSGALGYVEDIIFEENYNSSLDQMTRIIMVRFERYSHSTYDKNQFLMYWTDGDV